ncbi:MAG: TrkH family potassium uptake protein [Lachnospiraceae bacterium]|nr:TrkH family potassium uptake protein [Lachnospiraceae bacterium]
MNKKIIINNIGKIILVEVLLMLIPLGISLGYGEYQDAFAFLCAIIPVGIVSLICIRVKEPNMTLSSRDGYIIVAASWIIISLVGAIPMYITGAFSSYISAFFEIVSGFTTTGASVMEEPGVLGHGPQFFRCFSHWIGGMGVLVFVLMIIPMENDSSMHLVRAEVPGPTAGKLVPRMKTTSRILYGIYTALTLLLFLLLKICGMPVFDAFCYSFGAAGTGGFGITSAGISAYNSYTIEMIVAVFMLLFGVNFNLYYLILIGKIKEALNTEELKVYLSIVIFSVVAIFANLYPLYRNFAEVFRVSFFQVATIITTTGFATADFATWPMFSQHILVLLMIIGACAGSTAGGMKVSRIIILWKSMIAEIRGIINPKQVISVRMNGQPVDKKTLDSTRIYVAAYCILVGLSVLILSVNELDFTTNVTAVFACFNNIGPGLSLVGPTANYSCYSDWAKLILAFLMLTGRLEIFPLFMLFARSAHDQRRPLKLHKRL